MQRALLSWAAAHGRDLPWRRTRDPWAVLVSEVMLQQTQVARVIPVWTAFLERFPTPAACANADQADVVTAWHGMGYNRRARNLHQCAIAIRDLHDGSVPHTLEQLMGLPGVGPYTARAVMVFAFELPVGVVDVNAARVHDRVAGRPLSPKELQRAADEATPPGDAWRWNQAVLDLGATVCTKRAPRCDACPLRGVCAWQGAGDDPARHARAQSRFEGSDRQGRGRLVAALRGGVVSGEASALAAVMGWPDDPDRAERVARTLLDDGLVEWEQPPNTLRLRR